MSGTMPAYRDQASALTAVLFEPAVLQILKESGTTWLELGQLSAAIAQFLWPKGTKATYRPLLMTYLLLDTLVIGGVIEQKKQSPSDESPRWNYYYRLKQEDVS